MDYLDYVQMTKGQRFAYKIKSFFLGIPKAIKKFFLAIGHFFKMLFGGIGKFLKAYGTRFAKGDGATKLSYIIMGAGNIAHKQVIKGILFFITEVAYILFMIFFGSFYIGRIYSSSYVMLSPDNKYQGAYAFGTGSVGKTVIQYKEDGMFGRSLDTSMQYDDSNQILLFFVLTLIITIAFFAIYIANTKSAYASQEIVKSGKKPETFGSEMRSFLDERFHITMLALPILLLIVFNILPIIFTVFMAFTNYDKNHSPDTVLYQWVGFRNFADVFYSNPKQSATFGKILLWTLIWAFFATFTNFIFGIILALLINKKDIKFKGFWRTMFVITAAVPQFVTLNIMRLMLDDHGAFNEMITSIGLPSIRFLTDPNIARVTVIVVNMWVGIPYTMLISSGLLMNIPEDLYESARIDGANAFQQFTKITFPYIFFVMTPYLITTFVSNINNFNVIYFLVGAGDAAEGYYKAKETDLLVTWLYKLTNDESEYNLAAVIGILIFIICSIGSLIVFNMSKASKNEEEFS